MRKSICVPGSLLLCTASICPEQRGVEAAGERGEQRGPLSATSLPNLDVLHGAWQHLQEQQERRKAQRNSPLPPQHRQRETQHEALTYLLPLVSCAEVWRTSAGLCRCSLGAYSGGLEAKVWTRWPIFHFLTAVCSHFWLARSN